MENSKSRFTILLFPKLTINGKFYIIQIDNVTKQSGKVSENKVLVSMQLLLGLQAFLLMASEICNAKSKT
jgi:hypothetical protein